MPCITLCTSCGAMYEAGSEEQAAATSFTLGRNVSRLCPRCTSDGVTEAFLAGLDLRSAGYVRARMLERSPDDTDDL
jgi:hypothetical protein